MSKVARITHRAFFARSISVLIATAVIAVVHEVPVAYSFSQVPTVRHRTAVSSSMASTAYAPEGGLKRERLTVRDRAISILNQSGEWKTDASLDKVTALIGKAFSGTASAPEEPVISWVFRKILPEVGTPERVECFKFILNAAAFFDFLDRGAFYFGNFNEATDAYESCTVLLEVDPKKEYKRKKPLFATIQSAAEKALYFADALASGNFPSAFLKPSSLWELGKLGELEQMVAESHQKYGPKDRHIYVGLVGADPEIQGRGFGKKLMNQIGDLGDTLGMDCYLECAGAKNKSFYEKFGFKLAKAITLSGDDGSDCELYLMIREPSEPVGTAAVTN